MKISKENIKATKIDLKISCFIAFQNFRERKKLFKSKKRSCKTSKRIRYLFFYFTLYKSYEYRKAVVYQIFVGYIGVRDLEKVF